MKKEQTRRTSKPKGQQSSSKTKTNKKPSRCEDPNYVQIKSNMLTFDNTLQTVKDKLAARKDVLKILQKTPFWSIIKAYMEGQLTKVECQKSNYQIIRLIRLYNPETKKFKFSEGNEYEITSNDVSEIFGLPNKGNKLPSTTTSTRTNLDFEKKYFKNSKKITKTEVDRCLNTAIADDRKNNAMDVVRLLILELLITNLFCNSGATMAWTFLTMIDTLEAMNSYNWAQGVLDYMHFGLDQAMKNKKHKTNQPSVSGCLVLILVRNYIHLLILLYYLFSRALTLYIEKHVCSIGCVKELT